MKTLVSSLFLLFFSVGALCATTELKTSGTFTSNGTATASISWGTSVAAFVCVASANSTTSPTSHTVTGGSVTWVEMGTGIEVYQSRRGLSVLLATDGLGNVDTPADGTLTISAVGGSTYQETFYAVVEIAEYTASGIPKLGVSQVDTPTGSTSLSSGSIGTLANSDIAVICAANEGANVAFTGDTGVTQVEQLEGGGNVRSLYFGFSSTDSTPGVTWNTTTVGAGLIAFIAEDGVTGAHDAGGGGVSTVFGLQDPSRGIGQHKSQRLGGMMD